MVRIAEHLEGLAIGGTGSVGAATFRTPALLRAPGPAGRLPAPYLTSRPSPSGSRRVVLGGETGEVEVELPVLAPEVVPVATGVVPVGPATVLVHAPFESPALRELRSRPPELLVLGNARALWDDPEALVSAVGQIRADVGAEPLLWGPRVALPHRLPLLAYLGFDLLDTTEGALRAAAGEFLDPSLGPREEDRGARGCDCPACTSVPSGPLAEHARAAYRRAELEVSAALGAGRLRELVEARLAAEPALAEILRYADRDLGPMLEARAPVTGGATRTYVLAESVRRPEMRRFRDRLVERYRPPASKTVLLLVPCSRTKPYRNSPSHRRFGQALDGLRPAERVHIVSVSSPIGVVPRELEDLPPARHYDIPVTGDWSAEERELVLRGVRHLLAGGHYRRVIAHLEPAEYRFLLDELPTQGGSESTVVDGRPTSAASIGRLRAALAAALEDSEPVARGPLAVVAEELREVASVQFGRAAAERLFTSPVRLAGRPWFQRVTDGRRDLASLRDERGLFHLTVAGALRMADDLPRVDVDPSLSLEGDVFAPGVRGASPTIRTGDAVGLFQEGRLAAVGEAVLPGPLMGDLRRGLAVRVRHRRHGEGDTAKTVEPPAGAGR